MAPRKKSQQKITLSGNAFVLPLIVVSAQIMMIALNPDWELASIYTDIASGLRLQHHEGYRRLLSDCKRGKVDMIIVKSMSRLGRDALELIRQIREWKMLGITL